jgi:hypothetical protein
MQRRNTPASTNRMRLVRVFIGSWNVLCTYSVGPEATPKALKHLAQG